MADSSYEVIRWPVSAGAGNLTFRDSTGTPTSTTVAVSAATLFLAHGAASPPVPYVDIAATLETAINTAWVAMHATSALTFSVAQRPDGRLSITKDQASFVAGSDFSLDETTTPDTSVFGMSGDLTLPVTTGPDEQITPYQAGGQWHPGWRADHATPDGARRIFYQDVTLTGRPSGVTHVIADDLGTERALTWDLPGIPSARIFDSRAAVASFAQAADIQTGEPNTYERMMRFLFDDALPNGPAQRVVFVYDHNDPAQASAPDGGYYVVSKQAGAGDSDGGVLTTGMVAMDVRGVVSDLASEHYPIKLFLWSP